MRLVLVHGRAQGGKSPVELRESWTDALRRGVRATGLDPIAESVDIRMPYFGDELDRLTDLSRRDVGEVIARGEGGLPDRMPAELLFEIAARAGLNSAEIASELPPELRAVERGPQNWEWTRATARAISRRLPWLGAVALRRFVADVDTYLRRPSARTAINAMVAAEIAGDGPVVVVAHSLGSVVAYEVLAASGPEVEVPLFVTLGSPLGIEVVKRHLTRPLGMPEGVVRWLNGADVRDPIALYARLDRDVFPAHIDNVSDIHNRREAPHAIDGYLTDERVALAIARALAGERSSP